MGAADVTIPVTYLLVKEVNFKGSFRYGVDAFRTFLEDNVLINLLQPGDYPMAISLVAQGRIDLKPLVTHRYRLQTVI